MRMPSAEGVLSLPLPPGIEYGWCARPANPRRPRTLDILSQRGIIFPFSADPVEDILRPRSIFDVILICTQWRARDIEHEIRNVHGLDAELYVFHRGRVESLTRELEL